MHKLVQDYADGEFEKYEAKQRKLEVTTPVSDFDKVLDKIRLLEEKLKLPPPVKENSTKKRKGKGSRLKK